MKIFRFITESIGKVILWVKEKHRETKEEAADRQGYGGP